ncbi:hypothetical protein, partial [Enterobacter cloacae]|uniref:hypothetical protein n=1 Tax=Enterobacter cloacae TaxID=550 RepID=UPI002FFC2D92
RCHRQNMKTSIINGSEVSRLSVAIHFYQGFLLQAVVLLATVLSLIQSPPRMLMMTSKTRMLGC